MFIAMILADADDTIYDGMCVVRKHILLLCIQYLKRIEHLCVRTRQCKSAHNSSIAAEVVRYFDRIYHEEGLLKDLTAEERYQERLAKIKPLLDKLFAWLESLPVSGKSKLAEAVQYVLHEKPHLYTFLEDGNVPIDNNRAENAIRPFAVGRENWLFSNTAHGAMCSAALYSIVATAQANGIDAEHYLTKLFSHPAGTIILPLDT